MPDQKTATEIADAKTKITALEAEKARLEQQKEVAAVVAGLASLERQLAEQAMVAAQQVYEQAKQVELAALQRLFNLQQACDQQAPTD